MVGLIKGVLEGTPIFDLELPTKETGNHNYSVGLLAHAGIYSVSDIAGAARHRTGEFPTERLSGCRPVYRQQADSMLSA